MVGKNIVWSLALGLALSGCAFAPGSNITLGTQAPPNNAEVDLSDRMSVQAITPELLAQMKAAQPAPVANPVLDKAMKSYEYMVGPGDILNVVVWDHPELTNPLATLRATSDMSAAAGLAAANRPAASTPPAGGAPQGNVIDADGTMYFPYVGNVKVVGLRVREIRTLLHDRLSRYMPDPQVDVSVSSFRAQKVYVTGEVRNPGTVQITNVPVTLLDAVNQSGGVSQAADWKDVILTRDNQEFHYSLRDLYQRGDTRQNTLLQANDVVFVPRMDSSKVFVMGEVKRSETVPMTPNGLTLAEALSASGGINELTANASGVFVLRRDDSNSGKLIDVFQLNAKDATAFVLADAFPLRERDIIYVTAAPLARWNRVMSLLLPSVDFLYLDSQTRHNLVP